MKMVWFCFRVCPENTRLEKRNRWITLQTFPLPSLISFSHFLSTLHFHTQLVFLIWCEFGMILFPYVWINDFSHSVSQWTIYTVYGRCNYLVMGSFITIYIVHCLFILYRPVCSYIYDIYCCCIFSCYCIF
jgi:hypothetical protein